MTDVPQTADERPLEGLKVLDFSRVLAGPFSSAMLADAGAEVIKVEPFDGDDYRHMGLQREGRSANFEFVNRGKRSLALDLKHARAGDIVSGLARWADVAIENFKPGVTSRLGIDYGSLSALNPRIVYCSISGFGQTGPWSDRPAYDTVVQALSGLMDATGEPDGPPTLVGESIADIAAGMFASWGVMAALWRRHRTGKGCHLDVAMLDCLVAMMPTLVSRVAAGGLPARRVGLRHVNSAPFGAFRAREGLFVLAAANDRLFARMAQAIGRPELAQDARFVDNPSRKRYEADLVRVIEGWASTLSVAQAVAELSEHGVPAAPVLSVHDSLRSEHAAARGLVTLRRHSGSASCYVEQPVRFGHLPRGRTIDAPALGAHTTEILAGLGWAPDEIHDLHTDGVVR